ncbi:hypothetical protein ACP70R_003900 [Stipagrostis hirtigluma subsp. patula]
MTTETAPVVSGERHAASLVAAAVDPCNSNDGGEPAGHGKDAGEGLSDDTETGLFLVSLLSAGLAVWVLCRAGDHPAAVVWRLSVLVSGCLAFWIGALSGAGAPAVLFRASYAALAAFAVSNRLSAAAGMVAIFVEAVCVAGFFGYYLAVHTHRTNTGARMDTRRLSPEPEKIADEGSPSLQT